MDEDEQLDSYRYVTRRGLSIPVTQEMIDDFAPMRDMIARQLSEATDGFIGQRDTEETRENLSNAIRDSVSALGYEPENIVVSPANDQGVTYVSWNLPLSNLEVIESPYVPEDQVLVVDRDAMNRNLRGVQAQSVIIDEFANIPYNQDIFATFGQFPSIEELDSLQPNGSVTLKIDGYEATRAICSICGVDHVKETKCNHNRGYYYSADVDEPGNLCFWDMTLVDGRRITLPDITGMQVRIADVVLYDTWLELLGQKFPDRLPEPFSISEFFNEE